MRVMGMSQACLLMCLCLFELCLPPGVGIFILSLCNGLDVVSKAMLTTYALLEPPQHITIAGLATRLHNITHRYRPWQKMCLHIHLRSIAAPTHQRLRCQDVTTSPQGPRHLDVRRWTPLDKLLDPGEFSPRKNETKGNQTKGEPIL